MRQRVSRLRESLAVLRALWSEQSVSFQGRYYHLDNVSMEPKPLQKPGIPIIMGGRAEAVLKRSAEEADGWVAGGQGNPESFAETWSRVQDYARAAGKDPDTLEAGKLLYIAVGQDREACRDRLQEFTHAYYGPQFDVESNCAFGPSAECAEKIQGFIDAGVKTLMLGPTGPDLEQLSRIAAEVIPKLR